MERGHTIESLNFLPGGSKYKFGFRKIQNLQHDTFIVYGYNFVDLLETVSSIYFVLYLLCICGWEKQMKIEAPPLRISMSHLMQSTRKRPGVHPSCPVHTNYLWVPIKEARCNWYGTISKWINFMTENERVFPLIWMMRMGINDS